MRNCYNLLRHIPNPLLLMSSQQYNIDICKSINQLHSIDIILDSNAVTSLGHSTDFSNFHSIRKGDFHLSRTTCQILVNLLLHTTYLFLAQDRVELPCCLNIRSKQHICFLVRLLKQLLIKLCGLFQQFELWREDVGGPYHHSRMGVFGRGFPSLPPVYRIAFIHEYSQGFEVVYFFTFDLDLFGRGQIAEVHNDIGVFYAELEGGFVQDTILVLVGKERLFEWVLHLQVAHPWQQETHQFIEVVVASDEHVIFGQHGVQHIVGVLLRCELHQEMQQLTPNLGVLMVELQLSPWADAVDLFLATLSDIVQFIGLGAVHCDCVDGLSEFEVALAVDKQLYLGLSVEVVLQTVDPRAGVRERGADHLISVSHDFEVLRVVKHIFGGRGNVAELQQGVVFREGSLYHQGVVEETIADILHHQINVDRGKLSQGVGLYLVEVYCWSYVWTH